MGFLPADFVVPTLVAGPNFRMRPISVRDVVQVYDAVMSSRMRLWDLFGQLRGWPPPGMTLEECLVDIAWQQKESELRHSFAFAVMSTDETRLLGCVHIGPPSRVGADAELTFWVRDTESVPDLEQEVEDFVREWATSAWPFKHARFPGRDIPWQEWKALPRNPARGLARWGAG